MDVNGDAWRAFLGPLLNVEEVQQHLGATSSQEIDELVQKQRLLALPMDDGRLVYPAFQFTKQGGVHAEIERIIRIFAGVVLSPYTIASWLKGPKAYLEGEAPIRWLELGRDPGPVIAGAEVAAARLAR